MSRAREQDARTPAWADRNPVFKAVKVKIAAVEE